MKRVWYAVFCLGAIFILCIIEYFYTARVSEIILEKIDTAVAAQKNGDGKRAKSECSEIKKQWENSGKKLQLLLDHAELDKISLLVASAEEYLNQNMEKEFFVECEKLKECMLEFVASESRILNNIL